MTATICAVPWMLIPKPIWIYMEMNSSKVAVEDEEHGEAAHEEHHDFSEVIIHQVIETIEFVLGTVSHTASYLRLWALSLAHQQLSFVFFQKTILAGMGLRFPANIAVVYIL